MKSFTQHTLIIEDIRSKVRKLKNLSPEEKKKVIDFFKKNNQLEKEIDWNNKNLTITDFQYVFHTPTKAKIKKSVKKKGIGGLREGIDYIDVTYMFENHNAYIPLNYEASKHIASKYIGHCTGKWCTAYQKTDSYWKDYVIDKNTTLIYIISPDKDEKYAWAIKLKSNRWQIFDKKDSLVYDIPGENVYRIYKRYKRDLVKYDKMIDKHIEGHWIYDARISDDAKYRIKSNGYVYWENGIWYNGTWKYGEWRNGTWYNGTWKYGEWFNGEWKSGIWEDGAWERGIWRNGIWEDGTWKYGIWFDGTWENGIWENGLWKGGIWKGGTWEDGLWKKGTWEDGLWKKGTWEGGYDADGNYHEAGNSPDKW
jgi:hypothetical protein